MPDPPLSSPDQKVECPRCGYDQRGVVAAWRDACPLEGTCSECGLTFAWRDLLERKFKYPRWCVEYGHGIGALLRRSLTTLAMMFRPKKFWSELWMEHDQRPLRIIGVNVLLHVVLRYVFVCILLGFLIGKQAAAIRAAGVATDSPAIAGIRAAAMPWDSQLQWPWRLQNRWMDLQKYKYYPIGRSRLTIVRRQPLTAPITSTFGTYGARSMFWTCLVVLLTPLGMAALPISRRVAKVRWRHLGRIWLYSMPIFMIPTLVEAYVYLNYTAREVAIVRVAAIVALLLTFFWWRAAVKYYLRMPHAGAVTAAVMIVAFLAALALFGTLDLVADLISIWRLD